MEGHAYVNTNYDILIVGGGPAGISTWLHLQKYAPDLAQRTLLIEKMTYPRDKLCGGALGGWTEKIMENLNLELAIPAVPVNEVNCVLGNEKFSYKQDGFFNIIRRKEFDYFLADHARKKGLQLHENEMYVSHREHYDFLHVDTNRGTYRIQILIGADGSLSKVRQHIHSTIKPTLARTLEVFYPQNPAFDPEFTNNSVTIDFTLVLKGLQGYVWHFPCINEGRHYMNHGIGDFHIIPSTERPNLKDLFTTELRHRGIGTNAHTWRSHPIAIYQQGHKISSKNVLLVGDASGIDSAVAGGIHLALSYGDLAAQTIREAYQLNDFSFTEYQHKFDNHIVGRYIRKLNRLSQEMYATPSKIFPILQEIFSKR